MHEEATNSKRIDSSEDVVQKDDRRPRVDSPGKGDTSTLAAGESHAFFTDLRLVRILENGEVADEGAGLTITLFRQPMELLE